VKILIRYILIMVLFFVALVGVRNWVMWKQIDYIQGQARGNDPGNGLPFSAFMDLRPTMAQLKSANPYARQNAVAALGLMRHPKSVELLIGVLQDSNEAMEVRQEAFAALKSYDDPRARRALEAVKNEPPPPPKDPTINSDAKSQSFVLADEDKIASVREAIAALSSQDRALRIRAARNMAYHFNLPADHDTVLAEGFPILLGLLKDNDVIVRRETIFALEGIKDPRSVEPLIEALADADNRGQAGHALGILNDPQAVLPILAASREETRGIVTPLHESIALIGSAAVAPLLEGLQKYQTPKGENSKEWPEHRALSTAVRALGAIKDPRAAGPLLELIKAKPGSLLVPEAADALGKMENLPVQFFIDLLHHQNRYARAQAAKILGKYKEPSAINGLIVALHDEDTSVQANAAEALGEIGDAEAVQPMIQWLQSKYTQKARYENWVTGNVVKALAKIGDPRAVPTLIHAIRDSDDRVPGAREALRKFNVPQTAEWIVAAIQSRGKALRQFNRDELMAALGEAQIGGVTALTDFLKDADESNRRMALNALERLSSNRDARINDPAVMNAILTFFETGRGGLPLETTDLLFLENVSDPRARKILNQNKKTEEQGPQPLALTISSDKEVYEVGEDLWIEGFIRNRSKIIQTLRSSTVPAWDLNVLDWEVNNKEQLKLISIAKTDHPASVTIQPEDIFRLTKVNVKGFPVLNIPDVYMITAKFSQPDPSDSNAVPVIYTSNTLVIKIVPGSAASRRKEQLSAMDRLYESVKNQPGQWGGAINTLAGNLEDQDEEVRYHAVVLLGKIEDTRIEGPLTKARQDSSERIRKVAVEILARINNNKTVVSPAGESKG
jgi:HEAT repeat protein